MLKSVFSKYLTAFLAIFAVSFLILAFIMNATISGFSAQARENAVSSAAEAVSGFLSAEYQEGGEGSLPQYVYFERDMLQGALSLFTADGDCTNVYITDDAGAILLSGEEDDSAVGTSVAAEYLTSADGGVILSDLGGLFPSSYLICISSLHDSAGTDIGYVLVCSSERDTDGLSESMMKTLLGTCLWVALAAMLAVYFISDKISSPLKDMSYAAKQYASGKFDVRVPVRGNDEVAELATAFNNMATSLANSEELRRSFLGNVSHELRTPMTTISGFIDGIIDGAIPPEKQPYYLELIASEVRRLSRLVSSLLDITRIQAGDRKFTMTNFDICEMARQILISFEQRIDEKKLNIEIETDRDNMMVSADRDAIYQVLYNICDNAVKFSYTGGNYRVSIVEKDKKTYVSVRNDGQGIPEADLPYVFDRFYKSDKSRGLDKTGLGLGLYITKTIIDAHNEEIWVKSVYGEYCEFVFTLATAKG